MIKRIASIGLMTAFIAVCTYISVPFTVPFTLQTFAVICSLILLGGCDGTIAIAVYVLLGALGLPVFSGFNGGIGHILGLTGGYIVGFIFMGLFYWVMEKQTQKAAWVKYAVLAVGNLICYAFGTVWFAVVSANRGNPKSIPAILLICVVPYIIPDAVKLVLAVLISDRVKKAIKKK